MSIISNLVKGPVSLAELGNFFGVRQDVGTICTATKINKWAKNKPQGLTDAMRTAMASTVQVLTLADRRRGMMGLTLSQNSNLYKSVYDYNGANTTQLAATTLRASLTEATYKKPVGGATDPFRISDFLYTPNDSSSSESASVGTGDGYLHTAEAPDNGWKSVGGIPISNLKTAMDATLTFNTTTKVITASSESSLMLPNASMCNIKVLNSGQAIGSVNNVQISYEDIMGSNAFTGNDNDYRMCFAVLVPTLYTPGGTVISGLSNMWFIAPARYPFCQAGSVTSGKERYFFPDIAANQYLAYQMWCNAKKNTGTTYVIVPILVKGIKVSSINVSNTEYISSGTKAMLYPYIDSSSVVYGMASGSSQMELTFTTLNAQTVPELYDTKAEAILVNTSDTDKICIFKFQSGDVNDNNKSMDSYVIVRVVNEYDQWRLSSSTKKLSGSCTYNYNPINTTEVKATKTFSNDSQSSVTIKVNGENKTLNCWLVVSNMPNLHNMTTSNLSFT